MGDECVDGRNKSAVKIGNTDDEVVHKIHFTCFLVTGRGINDSQFVAGDSGALLAPLASAFGEQMKKERDIVLPSHVDGEECRR